MFDLQAHRGGMALRPENTLAAFRNALRIGVTTLECDVNVSADGVPMVTHDRVLDPAKVRDTAPATPGDPDFPYAGRLVSRLTHAQLRTLDLGSQTVRPGQVAVPGEPMPTFDEVLALVADLPEVHVNVEAKFDVVHPGETAPRRTFVTTVLDAVRRAGLADRVSVQSFDWHLLTMLGREEPRLPRYALTAPSYLQVGRLGRSPWLGGLDIDDLAGDLVAAAVELGFEAVSPVHGSPYDAGVGDPGYVPFVTRSMVDEAHRAGVLVVPYTVDPPATMAAFVDLGVDGFITNEPALAREVLAAKGLRLPDPVNLPEGPPR